MSRRAKGEIVLSEVDDRFLGTIYTDLVPKSDIQEMGRSEEVAYWKFLCSKYLTVYPIGVSSDPYENRILRRVYILA